MIGEMGMECFVLYYPWYMGLWLCQFGLNIFETKIKNCIRFLLCLILFSAELVGRIILQFFFEKLQCTIYSGIIFFQSSKTLENFNNSPFWTCNRDLEPLLL